MRRDSTTHTSENASISLDTSATNGHPVWMTEEDRQALVRQAKRIVALTVREAEATYHRYDVIWANHDALNVTRCTIQQPTAHHHPCTVELTTGCCSCSICQRTILPLRDALLRAGYTELDLQMECAWPTCKHPLIVALLQSEMPERFEVFAPRLHGERERDINREDFMKSVTSRNDYDTVATGNLSARLAAMGGAR